ncbi:MAG: hypothetical protein WC856_02485 [Methylococcaceae bacterium]|jgi:hypothetical protein
MADQELSSIWTGLNPALIASFWEVKRDGSRVEGGLTIRCPLLDVSLDQTQNWSSPWENILQSNLPTLQAMLQSGALQPLAKITDNKIGTNISGAAATVEGRSSVTRLNSIQVWAGSPPLKITLTALFRAWRDTMVEVELPMDTLIKWSLPVKLEADASILSDAISGGFDQATIFPSTVPVLISLNYKNRTYAPLVIESISMPLSGPIDSEGHFTEATISVTLCSITSIDRATWDGYSNSPGNSTIKFK